MSLAGLRIGGMRVMRIIVREKFFIGWVGVGIGKGVVRDCRLGLSLGVVITRYFDLHQFYQSFLYLPS